MGKATEDLRKEHESIIYVLRLLDEMIQSERLEPESRLRYYGELVYFLKMFADKCHHGKEEDYLFKELVHRGIPNEGGPVGVMLSEHVQGRAYIARMSRGFEEKNIEAFNEAAILYRDLLRQHIDKENRVLFMMADNVISETEQEALFEKFEQHEENVIGHGVHENLHAMIETWAKALNVD